MSYHLQIIVDININSSNNNKRATAKLTKFAYNKANWKLFKEECYKQIQHTNISINDSIHTSYKKWNSAIVKAARLTIPRGCRENAKPWRKENLDKCIKARNDARRSAHLDETKESYG